jgi:hypothetical protein
VSEDGHSKEAFLDRWSRRKRAETEENKPAPPATEAQPPQPPAQPLPPVAELKPDSDFKPFMDPGVDAGTRRSALKMLFTDAHFKAIDPFEPYSIDLTGEDPISDEMMKTLSHAKQHLFEDEQKAVQARLQAEAQARAQAEGTPQPQTHESDLKDVAGKQDA